MEKRMRNEEAKARAEASKGGDKGDDEPPQARAADPPGRDVTPPPAGFTAIPTPDGLATPVLLLPGQKLPYKAAPVSRPGTVRANPSGGPPFQAPPAGLNRP